MKEYGDLKAHISAVHFKFSSEENLNLQNIKNETFLVSKGYFLVKNHFNQNISSMGFY